MTIRVALHHRTTYRFDQPTVVHPHMVRLRPAPHCRTPIQAYSLTVSPPNHFVNWQQDAFGNYLARYVFPERVSELEFTVDLVADMTVINPFDFFVEEYAEHFPFEYPAELRSDLEPYLRPVDDNGPGSGPSQDIRDWMAEHGLRPQDCAAQDEPPRIVDYLVKVNRAVKDSVAYTVRLQPGVQTPQETLDAALGSCRDSGWMLVSVLREAGLAARFVSGYLVQLAADEKSLDGPSGPEQDFTDLHAWAEVYVPGAGWIGLDATSGLLCGEGHIPLSATPHPSSAAPITGATGVAKVEFDFENTVSRVFEDPRVTKPYTEEQWHRVQALGEHVDQLLTDADVRLTMGGEPTFVSVDDTSTPQWETAADGPDKRKRARDLAGRLKDRWAPNGISHHGEGKWYPGEPLPRWSIALIWRADGESLWADQSLLTDPWAEPANEAGSVEVGEAVREIALRVADGVGVPADFVQAAYEDPIELWHNEVRQPEGDRLTDDADPDAPAETRAHGEELEEHAGMPSGWVVPLFAAPDGAGWGTTRWSTRRAHLFLTPGSSPMGLRLPLASIAWTEAPYEPDRSPFAARGPLPAMAQLESSNAPAAQQLPIEDAPRTALCVEEREGTVYVFLPPLTEVEDALALLKIVEGAASATRTPVVLEGYPPPGDPRLRTLSVTPDPGVIEVNVQPTSSWSELEHLTTTLFEDARQSRLTTEKFDLDGTHTGTGGGNHMTLGGPSAVDSPMLRRPDLLRSLVTYWQHHPALSYVFSGRFIGPTSQSPRVDEGRNETLYELEIAFAEMERTTADGEPRPWLVDRLLRNLLTDITGNTHRAEFCIDKLYNPGSDRGRLGLLEMRGFEMPPHARMSLVQALLVRSLLARFWERPYAESLVRWGSRLHDRFLLPAFAAADLRDVVIDLNDFLGPQFSFDQTWLDPFLEFRFPRLGETDIDGVHLELRQAVEPWNVLGEEVSQAGTARYVDSSIEKVQVAATGLVEGRHVVTCNGVPVPLVPVSGSGWGLGSPGTGSAPDTWAGGVRYRAWAPPSALHPTIGVHSPLVFDLIDRWNERSLGGFTYHVVHPGGRNFETYPVNAAEAESRRNARFEPVGHSSGHIDTSNWPADKRVRHGAGEYTTTLDLRRFSAGHHDT